MKRKSRSFFNMQFITASISTMLVLLLLGLVVFFVLTANNLSVYVRENIAVSVQLSDDMPERDILQYQKRLNEAPYVKETTYISKVQALREQTEAMGTDPAEFIGHNPFNASIEIKLNSAYANSDSIQWIQDELLSNKNILEVNYPQELMDSVNRNLRKISLVLLGLAGLLTLISFALINNTIRLTIYSKRFLIHTMKLVGASWSFIRRPFLWQNIWIGIFAAILADALLTGMSYFLIRYEPDLLTVITPTVVLIMDGAVFIFGVIITTLCAWISINKFLRMKAGELYYM
ncbi:FtsX-like permease family protein [Phocaeicola barnesiae]|jgi:cell division transport system permease protein|uniref:cell division protein FtsX n=1 Tax=Phocaeicola barnesiae TaxID=376804 RepID=UPI00034152A6|nr:permease-like cell division protein FtsX [Phocaeicola barnesiae]MBS6468935.1 permease-like cell division protein FtsX [Bacteroides sp.]CDD33534.1 efflux ABC transporter permease protein [Bacteroides sp. CAG:714]MCF2575776.1 FtsX-like permease family protein [Phocaeicola barnesiae]MCF2599053.1 FtsX-like permease family protein [Phocaeicola barnesiae]MDM8253121.1 permease-like cell division protein FtsX [Phocaeicola barnesiae]